MLSAAQDVKGAQDYMINRLDYIIHDKHGSYNNCTVFTDDTFYVPYKYGLFCSICSLFNPFLNCRFQYGESCLDRNNHLMKKSKFCNCLWVYRERFENEVGSKKVSKLSSRNRNFYSALRGLDTNAADENGVLPGHGRAGKGLQPERERNDDLVEGLDVH